MAKTRCPYGMLIGEDYGDYKECLKCLGRSKEATRVCKALHDLKNECLFSLDGPELIHFARICFNLDFDTFARVTYGDHDMENRQAYLKGKYKIWTDNPMKIICQLDMGNLRTLAAYINRKLEEGDS